MGPADPHLMTLFASALDRAAAADRAAYLDAACGPDAGLRARVEALLRAHDQAGRFLEPAPGGEANTNTPAAPPHPETASGLRAEVLIAGRYRLLEEIGEGGMGTV